MRIVQSLLAVVFIVFALLAWSQNATAQPSPIFPDKWACRSGGSGSVQYWVDVVSEDTFKFVMNVHHASVTEMTNSVPALNGNVVIDSWMPQTSGALPLWTNGGNPIQLGMYTVQAHLADPAASHIGINIELVDRTYGNFWEKIACNRRFSVEGTVFGQDGLPKAGVPVSIRHQTYGEATVRTAADGTYMVKWLNAGPYQLQVEGYSTEEGVRKVQLLANTVGVDFHITGEVEPTPIPSPQPQQKRVYIPVLTR